MSMEEIIDSSGLDRKHNSGFRSKRLFLRPPTLEHKPLTTTGFPLHLYSPSTPPPCLCPFTPLVERGVQRKPFTTREQRPLICIISSERIVRPCRLQPRRRS